MRIVIDLQACQTSGSRTRGIGRYSAALAQAMARHAGHHEIWLLLSGLFPETITPLRNAFAELVPSERIRIWSTSAPTAEHHPGNAWRRQAAEIVREQALAELRPDVVHVASLFEGFSDDGVTSVGATRDHLPTAVTLYDLIPLVHADPYLANPQVRAWYYRKLDALKQADLLLSISEASRQEALSWLQLPDERIVNISSAVDSRFRPQVHDPEMLADMKRRYGITRPFVMYTGGIDLRKNIEGLIRAYAALPPALRLQYQLAIVCSAHPEDKVRLQALAMQSGLGQDEFIMTGFVPDEELPMLYNDCALFVFPSWHEGFGLPALEAMACGAAVIAANTSSLPEVIGRADALFDPRAEISITAKMHEALSNAQFRDVLREHGLRQAEKFSWDQSGKRALAAFEQTFEHDRRTMLVSCSDAVPQRKPILAFVAPLPPVRSGIADYCLELLPELTRYYDIELVVDQPAVEDAWLNANCRIRDWRWFEAHAERFDRIVYQIGNSQFHSHMFGLLSRHPGTVVLHDFFMSGVLSRMEFHGEQPGIWVHALYASHGYVALIDKRREQANAVDTIMRYPCNAAVIDKADGIIVHAEYSKKLAEQWYGQETADNWAVIPILRRMPVRIDRKAKREELGVADGDFIVCSFGLLGPTKLNDRLLLAWLDSPLSRDPRCHLVFVGENHGGDYGEALLKRIGESGCGDRIHITGYVDAAQFRTYLAAADAAVQLRTLSRGETSAAVLDCMAHGVPTIINAHGTMAELPDRALIKLPDAFSNEALSAALVELRNDPERRQALGSLAMEHVRAHHAPAVIGARYYRAIEQFSRMDPRARRRRAVAAIAAIESSASVNESDLFGVASGLAAAYVNPGVKQILIDVTGFVNSASGESPAIAPPSLLYELLVSPPPGYRVEPVFGGQDGIRYARRFTCEFLGLPTWAGWDDVIDVRCGDVFAYLSDREKRDALPRDVLERLEAFGVKIHATLKDALTEIGVQSAQGHIVKEQAEFDDTYHEDSIH